ncbi:MAG: DUF4215 domain-containing protein [Deltaproteobacteria bacterium]
MVRNLSTERLWVLPLALLVGLAMAVPAGAQSLTRKQIRCQGLVLKLARSTSGRMHKVRYKCAHRKAIGKLAAEVDCAADPVDNGGTGTGYDRMDTRLSRSLKYKGRLGKRCKDEDTAVVGVDATCGTNTTDWDEIGQCALNLGHSSADTLFKLTYLAGAGPLDKYERACRQKVSDAARRAVNSRLQSRSRCFRTEAKSGTDLNCLATVGWPQARESTGSVKFDDKLKTGLSRVPSAVLSPCGPLLVDVDTLGLAELVGGDRTGGEFTADDLLHATLDSILAQETAIVGAIYSGESYCGDGIVDEDEQCDDGNRLSCDGCDRDCTLPACNNGALCGEFETCDDGGGGLCIKSDGSLTKAKGVVCYTDSECGAGNTCATNGDDCTDACQAATCGDGYVRVNREQCDGGLDNSNTNPDACRSSVDVTLELIYDPLVSTSHNIFRLESSAEFGDIEAGDSVEVVLPGIASTVNSVGSSDIVGQRTVLSSPAPGPNYIFFTPGSGTSFSPLTGQHGGAGGTLLATLSCRTAHCGDGVTDTGEYCDDANLANDDGCPTTCLAESCGDGILQTWDGEQCDNGVANSNSTADACRLDCTNAFCGDSVTDTGEECDQGADNSNVAGAICHEDCTAAGCGDGFVDSSLGETCDDGNTSNTDACLNSCRQAACGDGFLEAGVEQCDDGNNASGDGCSDTCLTE